MVPEKMQELIIMLLILKGGYPRQYRDWYDMAAFNNRYNDLLEEFFNDYALTKTEKSD